jgi:hypothetical protein
MNGWGHRCVAAVLGSAGALMLLCSTTGRASADPGPAITGSVKQGTEASIEAHGVGPDATGNLEAAGLFHATVTCLMVSGNDAIATAVIVSSQDPGFPIGEIIVVEGVDNGNPSQGSSPDLWRISFQNNGGILPTDDPRCSLPVFMPVPIESGNIQVVGGS